jgi:hypothetical protein
MAGLQVNDTETPVAQRDLVIDMIPAVVGAAVHQTRGHFRDLSLQTLLIGFLVIKYARYAAHNFLRSSLHFFDQTQLAPGFEQIPMLNFFC